MKYAAFLVLAATAALFALTGDGLAPSATANPGAVTFREPAFGLPHIYADTDVELVREYGRQAAKDRLGQFVLLGRVGRGTLYQAFGFLEPSTFNDDYLARRDAYTSAELNHMFAMLPGDIQLLLLEYARGVNDVIDDVYAGSEPEPLEVSFLRNMGLGNDLFGNATNISGQADPYYKAPGGADPERPNGGFQFTPEIIMSIAVLQVRNFGSESFSESSRLSELQKLLTAYPSTGDEMWNDLNYLNDPLAPVSVPDATTPGFGGPLALAPQGGAASGALVSQAAGYSDTAQVSDEDAYDHREEFARSLGAWPAMGSYAWMIDGDRSATGNPWIGGFPQTGIQVPSIMHFVELRSAEGSDHRIQVRGMAFAGAPAVLIGETDNVAWTSTTALLKNNDTYLEQLVLEDTNALRYSDEGTPAAMNQRTETIVGPLGASSTVTVWRTHERMGNGGSRTVQSFAGDRTGTADSATATSLTDAGAFGGSGYTTGYVAITAGPGAGQMRAILSNTTDTLTLANVWMTPPTSASSYVAVRPGSDIIATAIDRAFWLEESQTALGFSFFQRSEDVLDIRRGARMMPSTHNFLAADNQAFNGIGTNLGAGSGNTGYWTTGFSRIRQGAPATDTRLPLDGTQPDELVLLSGTVGSVGASTLTSAGAFTGEDFSPPGYNARLNNPTTPASEYIVTITGGIGYRQTRRIASNTNDTLTLEEDWVVPPATGDRFEVYEIVAMPEAINPPQGYTANWNNKSATLDDASDFGRQHRVIFILERLAADSTWTRNEQRQLNTELGGLDPKGDFGRYVIPRLRLAVDGVGDGGNASVIPVLEALEDFQAAPLLGRGFTDAVGSTMIEGEIQFLETLIGNLSNAIYGDEFSGTGVSPPGGSKGLAIVQHAIDSAAGGPIGAYAEVYSGDYFNGVNWRIVVRDAFAGTITQLGGIPADVVRPDSTYAHPLSALYPNLVFEPTLIANRGHYEQIVEVGPTVRGEFIFSLGQSGFIDEGGLPAVHVDSLHDIWRDYRFAPMLHVAEDLAIDPDGDIDNDGVLDGFEKWYYGSNAPAPTSDTDSDSLTLLQEYQATSDPTTADTDADGDTDGSDNCANAANPGQENLDGDALGDDCDPDIDNDGCSNAREALFNETRGGLRDETNKWDFFDVDGNRKVSLLGDIVPVILAFGQGPNDPGGPGPNYSMAKDRGAQTGTYAWNRAGPDGKIQLLSDIIPVILQFGHRCDAAG